MELCDLCIHLIFFISGASTGLKWSQTFAKYSLSLQEIFRESEYVTSLILSSSGKVLSGESAFFV